ncbi:hypothetical protein TNCV_1086941 [Trichonephila clavipes]|nr:hypothetical protein TNCV_1086941 [Trichonephila clavipes]
MDGERVNEARRKKDPKRGRGGATRGGSAKQDETWAEPNTENGETGLGNMITLADFQSEGKYLFKTGVDDFSEMSNSIKW